MQGKTILHEKDAGRILAGWLGEGVQCTGVEPLTGGVCYSVFRMRFDKPPHEAVVKIGGGSDDFGRERKRLLYVRAETRLPCPMMYHEDSSRKSVPYPFLIVESLPGVDLGGANLSLQQREQVERELAATLLELHSHKRETFGEVDEAGTKRWTSVFMPRLIDIRGDMEGRVAAEVLGDIDKAIGAAPNIVGEQGEPTLVHGDIWAGNMLVVEREDGWHLSGLLDLAAVQYADVEYELAYLEAHGTIGQAFFKEYARDNPMRPGYEFRRLFYWLHTYMVHIWLLGEPVYYEKTQKTAREIVGWL